MDCFGPIELATCPYCGPHAGLGVSKDKRYQECIECRRELVNDGSLVKHKYKPKQLKPEDLPPKLVETFKGIVFTQELIENVLYRDIKGDKYGNVEGVWEKVPPPPKRHIEEIEYRVFCSIM
jgi:hypothetical protein